MAKSDDQIIFPGKENVKGVQGQIERSTEFADWLLSEIDAENGKRIFPSAEPPRFGQRDPET